MQSHAKGIAVDDNRAYRFGILALCAGYLLFQLIFIPYTLLSRDELWFAHHTYRYLHALPYRDFAPYKTVIGYYLLSLPMHFSAGVLAPLHAVKTTVAAINALMIAGIAGWSCRWFAPRAIFYTVLILLSSHFFLIYSADLRVDMLASWCCLLSFFCILAQRWGWGGVSLALGFLVSQKVLWYGVASEGALLCGFFLTSQARTATRAMLQFNLAGLLTIGVYIAVWSAFADVSVVLHSMFYEAYTQSVIHYYDSGYKVYWQAILRAGPVLVLLWPLTFVSLIEQTAPSAAHDRRIMIVVYASLALFMMELYQQFFPYNIVFLVPAFWVLYAEFFSWTEGLCAGQTSRVALSPRQWFWLLSIYLLGLFLLIVYLRLALVYLLVLLLPLLLWFALTHPRSLQSASKRLAFTILWWSILVMTGVVAPLVRASYAAHALNGDYQQTLMRLTHDMTQQGGSYVAGTPLLYDQDQSVAGLKNLISPAVEYLHTQNPRLLPVLLPALDLVPRTVAEVLQDLQQQPVKVLVNNERIAGLPAAILEYLRSQYYHYWGGIYLYAPVVSADQTVFSLKFTARYQLQLAQDQWVKIDGKEYGANAIIPLQQGAHQSQGTVAYRLLLQPDIETSSLSPMTYHDCTACFVKPVVF